MKEEIVSKNAPEAIGPYSQEIRSGSLIFCSGQIPLRLDGSLVEGDIKEQTIQVLENLKNVLKEAGTSLDSVVKTTIYLVDLNDFQAVNETYAGFFKEPYPARSTVGVAGLPRGAKIEIEAVAEVQ